MTDTLRFVASALTAVALIIALHTGNWFGVCCFVGSLACFAYSYVTRHRKP